MPVRQHKEPRNQQGSRDKELPVPAADYSHSETRFANPERLDSNVSRQDIESRLPPNSRLQIYPGDEFKIPEGDFPVLRRASTSLNEGTSEEHRTVGGQLQRGDQQPGSAPSDPKIRDEAKYDELGKLRTGCLIRHPANGEHQQQCSGKSSQLSPNHTDQVPHSRETTKARADDALEKKVIQEKFLAEIAELNEAHRQSLENEKKATDEQRSKWKIAQETNAHLSRELESKSGDLEIGQQAWEKSKAELSAMSTRLQSTREDADRLERLFAERTSQIKILEQKLTESERQRAIFEQTQANERSRHADIVATLNQKHQTVAATFDKQIVSLTERHTREIDQLQQTYENKISRLVQEHEGKVDFYRESIESAKTEAEKKRQKLVLAHEEHLVQLVDKHKKTVDQLIDKHENTVDQLIDKHERTLDQLMDKHDRTVTQMKGELTQKKADLVQLARDEEKKRQDLTASYDEERTQTFKGHEQALSCLRDELAEVRRDKELEISQLRQAHAAELDLKDLDYVQGTRQIREDVQRLNAALLTRDDQLYQGELFTTSNLPTRPDEQIQTKFSEIEQMVDSIGRLQWKQEPAVWTSDVLRAVGDNIIDRVLKKAIVQDLVWCLLFTHIFCSPFRVFGAEGRLLEEEWIEQCGQDEDSSEQVFSWPEPGARTERWRYMTVKECREVLRPPVPSEWDPRMRLRKGFMDNYKEFMSELKASLERIADLTPADMKMIERLVKKAATVWLDFAIHRCRIVIRMNDSAALSMEEKVARARSSPLELIVVPAVVRYGNVTGADLDMSRTVDRCAGKSIVIRIPR